MSSKNIKSEKIVKRNIKDTLLTRNIYKKTFVDIAHIAI